MFFVFFFPIEKKGQVVSKKAYHAHVLRGEGAVGECMWEHCMLLREHDTVEAEYLWKVLSSNKGGEMSAR